MKIPHLGLYSEPYGSTGNIGENFRRLLGAPSLDPLQTLIREAVQNIADAAKFGKGPEILIRLRSLTSEQSSALRAKVFKDLPVEDHSRQQILTVLSNEPVVVFEICDFNTSGLGGPTRSDRIPLGTTTTDFIDFLRNIGTPRDNHGGGGTYGFGKVALYRASSCSTIIVDTLPRGCTPDQRRLIACHVGHSFNLAEDGHLRRYTGRHWWGHLDATDGIADPVSGAEAALIADELGLPERTEGQFGTTIQILGFKIEEDDMHAVGGRVIETLIWNFWPRMMSDLPESRRFVCRVEVEGVELPVPGPELFAPIDLMCKAMRAARTQTGNDVRDIHLNRPSRHLGTLAIERGLRSPRRPLVEIDSLVPDALHHIALMRPVELVVRYLKGTPLSDERLEWGGVFITSSDEAVEGAFADSEPPAHDDWIPDNLPRGIEKRYVSSAIKQISAFAQSYGIEHVLPLPGAPSSALARIAEKLGSMLEGDTTEAPRQPRTKASSKRPVRARASVPVFDRLELGPTGRIGVFTTEIIQDKDRTGKTLAVWSQVAIDGAGAGPIEGVAELPSVVSIAPADGGSGTLGGIYLLEGAEGLFEIRVHMPPDCAVSVVAEIHAGTAP
jgi:hypothetical protein